MKPKSKVGFLKHLQRGNSCLNQQMIHINQPSGIEMERLEESSQQFPNHVGSSPFLSQVLLHIRQLWVVRSVQGWGDDFGLEKPAGSAQQLLLCALSIPLGEHSPVFPCVFLLCCFFPAAAQVSRSSRAPGQGSEGAFPRFWAQTLLVLGVSLDLKAKEGGQWRKLEMIP